MVSTSHHLIHCVFQVNESKGSIMCKKQDVRELKHFMFEQQFEKRLVAISSSHWAR